MARISQRASRLCGGSTAGYWCGWLRCVARLALVLRTAPAPEAVGEEIEHDDDHRRIRIYCSRVYWKNNTLLTLIESSAAVATADARRCLLRLLCAGGAACCLGSLGWMEEGLLVVLARVFLPGS